MTSHSKYKWHFIGSLITISLIAIIAFVCMSLSYHNRLDKIAKLQEQDCLRMETLLKPHSQKSSCLKTDTFNLSHVFKEHEDRMQGLMEMEFEKLQNDFNFISLWAGLITIVFLIFSIYSIFKTDEMLKKSEAVYERMRRQKEKLEQNAKDINQKYRDNLGSLKEESRSFLTELAQKAGTIEKKLQSADSKVNHTFFSEDETRQTESDDLTTKEPT